MKHDSGKSYLVATIFAVALCACSFEAGEDGAMASENDTPKADTASPEKRGAPPEYYELPNLGFKNCSDTFHEVYLLGAGSRKVAVALPHLGKCTIGPFSDRLGVFIQESAGWRLFFTGDYNPPVNFVDRGGQKRRLSMTSREGGPRLVFEVQSGDVALVTDQGEIIATSAPL